MMIELPFSIFTCVLAPAIFKTAGLILVGAHRNSERFAVLIPGVSGQTKSGEDGPGELDGRAGVRAGGPDIDGRSVGRTLADLAIVPM